MEEAWELAAVRVTIRLDYLFNGTSSHRLLDVERERIISAINALDSDRVLNTSIEDLVSFFFENHVMDVPVMNADDIIVDQQERDIDVSHDRMRYVRDRSRPLHVKGTAVTVEVPFTGDGNFFDIQPSTYSMNGVHGTRNRNSIFFEIKGTDLTSDGVKQEIDSRVSQYTTNLDRLRQDTAPFNASLESLIRTQLEQRRKKLLSDKDLVSGLGFKMRQRDGDSATYVAPQVRKKIKPVLPTPSVEPFKPEPVMSLDDFNNILGILDSMARVMELSPSAFRTLGEEDIRMQFLVQLNGHYEGQATGETFNYEGKTDILVKSEGKNIFISECKFWSGPKGLHETIDQILGYLSWRDTKAAVVIFSRNKSFSAVVEQIPECVQEHPKCKKFLNNRSETSWEYIFSHKDDVNREIRIAVMAFNVPNEA